MTERDASRTDLAMQIAEHWNKYHEAPDYRRVGKDELAVKGWWDGKNTREWVYPDRG